MCLHKPMLCLLCAALLLTGCGYDPPAAETAAPPETTSAATTTTTCTTTTTTITAETQFSDDTDDLAPVPEQPPRPDFSGNVTRSGSRVLIEGVPHIYQSDRYPTACESIAATELLQYYGFDIDVDTFIRDYLPTAPYLSPGADGQYHGESPWEFFIGNPTDANGFGCYNGAIKAAFDAVSKELGSALRGAPLSALCRFIDSGEPVIIWATDGMGSETEISKSWILPDGSKFSFITPEHALVLVGYDDTQYYFVDSRSAADIVSYGKQQVEKAYSLLYSRAAVIQTQNLPEAIAFSPINADMPVLEPAE